MNATVSHAVSDNLTLLLDLIYGQQTDAIDPATGTAGDANYYGVAGYAVYRVDPRVSLSGRLEWFRDEEGFATSVGQTLWEATLGLTITPFPESELGRNLKIRPEVRYDYSTEEFFDGLTDNDQFTFAIDAIFNL